MSRCIYRCQTKRSPIIILQYNAKCCIVSPTFPQTGDDGLSFVKSSSDLLPLSWNSLRKLLVILATMAEPSEAAGSEKQSFLLSSLFLEQKKIIKLEAPHSSSFWNLWLKFKEVLHETSEENVTLDWRLSLSMSASSARGPTRTAAHGGGGAQL